MPGQNSALEYEISDPPQPELYNIPSLIVTPSDCVQSYAYEVVFAGTNTVPPFVVDVSSAGITIQSGDENDIGTIALELKITPEGPNTSGTLVVPFTMQIIGCVFEVLSVTSPIGTVIYQIDNGAVPVSGQFTSQYPVDC